MAGCGTSLIILPVMFGLYGVILQPLTYFMQLTAAQISEIATRLGVEMTGGYAQINLAHQIYLNFDKVADVSAKLMPVSFTFGPINLAESANFKQFSVQWVIPILAALSSLGLSWLTQKLSSQNANPQAQASNRMMMFMMPLMSLWFCFALPAGLGVYWISNNVLSAAQEYFLTKWMKKKLEGSSSEQE